MFSKISCVCACMHSSEKWCLSAVFLRLLCRANEVSYVKQLANDKCFPVYIVQKQTLFNQEQASAYSVRTVASSETNAVLCVG